MINIIYLLIGTFLLTGCQDEKEQESVTNIEESNDREEQQAEEEIETGEYKEDEIINLDDYHLPDKTKGFFWKGTDENNQFYFLGTTHIGTEDMYPLADDIELAFRNSDILLLEKDYSSEEQEELVQEFTYYQGGETLEDHMPEEIIDYLREYSLQSPMTFGYMNSMRPYALIQDISYYEIEKGGLTSEFGVEPYLLDNKPENMSIIGLEGRERYEPLLDLPNDYFAYELVKLFNNMNEQVNEAIMGYIGYRLGKETMLPGIERDVELVDGNKQFEQLYIDHMMVKRDELMANRITEISNDYAGKVFFVAIGAAHFFNEGNVLELLEDKGFELERIH